MKQPDRKFAEAKAAGYIMQVVQALKYLHSKNVLHRDIKPENLLNCMGTIKLSDFGWSKHSPDNNRNTFCGTLDYLPPEMVNKSTYDRSVDIWSIGVLTYEFLTGRPPFESDTQTMTYEKIKNLDIEFPADMSDFAIDFIRGILQLDGKDRPDLEQIEGHPWLNQVE